MNEPNSELHDWLEEVLEDAVASPSSNVRRNALVALAAIGGGRCMRLFARLVGEEALRANAGEANSREVLDAARHELKSMSSEDRELLDQILTRENKEIWVRPARIVIQDSNPLSAWIGHRQIAPGRRFWRTLAAAYWGVVAGAAGIALFVVLPISILYSLSLSDVANDLLADLPLLFILIASGVIGFAAAMTATPLLRQRSALAVDSAVAGVLVAVLGVLAAAAGPVILLTQAYAPEAGWVFIALAAPGIALARWRAGLDMARTPRLAVSLSAVAWPILAATVVCIAAQWAPGRWDEAASLAWVAFVLTASAFVSALPQVDKGTQLRPLFHFRYLPMDAPIALGITAFGLLALGIWGKLTISRTEPITLTAPTDTLPEPRAFRHDTVYSINLDTNSGVRLIVPGYNGRICVDRYEIQTQGNSEARLADENRFPDFASQERLPRAVGIERDRGGTIELRLTSGDSCALRSRSGPRGWLPALANRQSESSAGPAGRIFKYDRGPNWVFSQADGQRWDPETTPVLQFDLGEGGFGTVRFASPSLGLPRVLIVERLEFLAEGLWAVTPFARVRAVEPDPNSGAGYLEFLGGRGVQLHRGRYRICGRVFGELVDCESLPYQVTREPIVRGGILEGG